MTGDESTTGRRRLLTAVGSSVLAVGLAGCSGGGGNDDEGGGQKTTTDGGGNGGDDTTTETTTVETTTTETTTVETTTTEDSSTGGGGGSDSATDVHEVASDDGHDWAAIADEEKVGPFDAPDGAPTAFGYARMASELTVSYGAMTGSDTVTGGTLYVLLLVDGSVEHVVAWETPIESGEEFTVAPNGGVVHMDASDVTTMVYAWEPSDGDLVVVEKEDFEF